MVLRYSINVTLDGSCYHESGLPPDEESMRFWTDRMLQADVLLYGRTTYEMMQEAWRRPSDRIWPDWMQTWEIPFAEAIDAKPKHVVSSQLAAVDWNAHLVTGDLAEAARRLAAEHDLVAVGGVALPRALAELGLIDEYEFVVHPVVVGHGPRLLEGLTAQLNLELLERREFLSGATALRYRSSSA